MKLDYCAKVEDKDTLIYDITSIELMEPLYGDKVIEGALYSLYAFIGKDRSIVLKVGMGENSDTLSPIVDEISIEPPLQREIYDEIKRELSLSGTNLDLEVDTFYKD